MVNLLEKYRGLNLKSDVRTDSLMEPDDIYETKLALNKTGHYEEPEWGLSEFTDEALFSGIKSFQKENNLKIDGIMKPGGETETKLNNIMATKNKDKLQEFNGDYVNKLFAENKQKELDKNKKMSGREIVEKSLEMADKFSKPNVMNFSGKSEASSGGDSSGDGEGLLSGMGEMFSKLGEMIGLGDDEKETTSDRGSSDDTVEFKTPIPELDNVKFEDKSFNTELNKINNTKEKIDYEKYFKNNDKITPKMKKEVDEMLGDKVFADAILKTEKFEGGYSNDPDDPGKETNFGITKKWYPNEDIKNLAKDRAKYIIYRDYYKYQNINRLPNSIRWKVMDNAVNQGQPTAIKNMQKAIGVKADGLIGPKTLAKIQEIYAKDNKMKKFSDYFSKNVKNIYKSNQEKNKKQLKYNKGHMRRADSYK